MEAARASRHNKDRHLYLVPDSPENPQTFQSYPSGIMVQHGKSHVVEYGPENDQLFYFDTKNHQQQTAYTSSAIVIDSLLTHLEARTDINKTPRKFAFFDTDGNFYNQAHLEGIDAHTKRNGHSVIKHTAHFVIQAAGEAAHIITKPIDDIHVVGFANYPLTWEGDQS